MLSEALTIACCPCWWSIWGLQRAHCEVGDMLCMGPHPFSVPLNLALENVEDSAVFDSAACCRYLLLSELPSHPSVQHHQHQHHLQGRLRSKKRVDSCRVFAQLALQIDSVHLVCMLLPLSARHLHTLAVHGTSVMTTTPVVKAKTRSNAMPKVYIDLAHQEGGRAARERWQGRTKFVTNVLQNSPTIGMQRISLGLLLSTLKHVVNAYFCLKHSTKGSENAGYARRAQGLHERWLLVTTETFQHKERLIESVHCRRLGMLL